jgi:putative hydrolase of the HAD superfamily
MQEISRRIDLYMIERVGLTGEQTMALRPRYWDQYGTTLRGLMLEYDVDPNEYLKFVHDFPVEDYLKPDPVLARSLEWLPLRKVLFTNASAEHGQRVMEALGISNHFTRIFDIEFLELVNKPDPDSYRAVLGALGVDGEQCMMVDDSPANLRTAASLGMITVQIGPDHSDFRADFAFDSVSGVHHIVADLEARRLISPV